MSAKNTSRKKSDKLTKKQLTAIAIVVAVAVVALCLIMAIVLLINSNNQSDTPEVDDKPTKVPAQIEQIEDAAINLGHGMVITNIGSYTGVYMEDGSDEILSGILMIIVTNTGTETIQYAEITLPVGDKMASFSLSTLLPDASVVLLEKNRMPYAKDAALTSALAKNVAVFSDPLILHEDKLKLQVLDGAINVTNVSDEDISGEIVIYYKNSSTDLFYGGITYRVRIEGGLKAGEIRQVTASHLSDSGSTIVFVTCG